MRDIELFYRLKEAVLHSYQSHHPYFQGSWQSFGSNDIQNLIDAIEKETKQTISEKWVYTHLKPETNNKLPRKDMLNILSSFAGYSGWDEFIFKTQSKPAPQTTFGKKQFWVLALFISLGCIVTWSLYQYVRQTSENEVPTHVAKKRDTIPATRENDLSLPTDNPPSVSFLQVEDYTMILTGFMQSDVTDWDARRQQLDNMLSNDLEVVLVLRDSLGAEYLNKDEFSQRLVLPTASVKKMKITSLQTDDQNKVRFIRIKQN